MSISDLELLSSAKSQADRKHWIHAQNAWLASVPIVLSVHIWSILHVLEEIPAWILRLTVWELLGAISYTQVFALLESVFILVLFLAVRLLIPKRWASDHFVPATSLIVLVATAWAIAAHNYDQVIRNWGAREFLPWLVLVLISLVPAPVLVIRSEKVRNILTMLVKRAAVLSAIYLLIDGLSLIVVLSRNI